MKEELDGISDQQRSDFDFVIKALAHQRDMFAVMKKPFADSKRVAEESKRIAEQSLQIAEESRQAVENGMEAVDKTAAALTTYVVRADQRYKRIMRRIKVLEKQQPPAA